MFAKANDGTQIPMSMVHRKDVDINSGNTPTMVYVIAHIRGGGEMGRYWYEEQGKYLNKRNTFTDFINCAEKLIEMNITNPEKLATEGRSAGGLLMGAVLNM